MKNRKILIRFLEFPSVKFPKIWQRSYSLLAFLTFNFSEEFVRQGFHSAKKHKNAKNEKNTLTNPTFYDFKSFLFPDYTCFEHIRKFYGRKLKKIEIKAKQTSNNGDVWVVLRTFAPKSSHAQIFLKLWLQVENDKIRLKT